tara:strand:- start:46 stop:501 length:456 start_codon:yes stop_codon:yes gene_type:complete
MSSQIGPNITYVDATAQFELGQIFRNTDGKSYKYITYSEEAAATDGVAGEVCYYVADNGIMANDVTSDLSASDEIGAGVLQATMSDNEFGWIQVKGSATLTIALTAGADGSPLTPTGSADGTLDVSADVTDNVCAIAGDASAKEILCNFPD